MACISRMVNQLTPTGYDTGDSHYGSSVYWRLSGYYVNDDNYTSSDMVLLQNDRRHACESDLTVPSHNGQCN